MIRRLLAALLLFSVVSVAGPARAAVELAPEEPIGGKEITFKTDDGVTIVGNAFRPAKGEVKGGILFVHEPFRTSRDWAYLAEKMSRKGFVTMVFDLRGHGRSLMRGDEALDRELFADEDYQAMSADVRAALAILRKQPGVQAEQIHVAGADLGGSLSLMLANEDEGVRSVALLSPGLGYDGVNVIGEVAKLGRRPLMLVFSMEDGYARKSTEVMQGEAVGPIHTETYYGVGHGTKMLAHEPKLEALMASWFLGTVIKADGRRLEDAGKPVADSKELAVDGMDADAERKRLEAQKAEADKRQGVGVGDEEDEPKRFPAGDERQKRED